MSEQKTSSQLLIHVSLLAALTVWAVMSLNADLSKRNDWPTFRNEPPTVRPLYDDENVIPDADLEAVLWKLRPQLRSPQEKINYIDHALRMWSPVASFSDPNCISGLEMLELMLDNRKFRNSYGDNFKPLMYLDEYGVRVRVQEGAGSSSHVDHTIAGLSEVGVPLDYPVVTETGETTVAAILDAALKNFRINQFEYEWSTLAFAHYLEPTEGWHSREGEWITFDRMAERIMRQRLVEGVCRGNHRLHTLTMLLRIDDNQPLLSPEMRTKIIAHLRDVTDRLIQTQQAEGFWNPEWPGDEWDGPQDVEGLPLGIKADRILVTGHTLEWWALAPEELQPPREVVVKAAQWLNTTIQELSPGEVKSYYTFLTHAGRALAMWRGQFPHEVITPEFELESIHSTLLPAE